MPEVVQGRRVPAQVPEHDAAPVQYPPQQYAGGQLDAAIEGGESARRLACVDERGPQGPEHIGLAFRRTVLAGQLQRAAQLADPGIDITGIAQDDPGGLTSDGGLMRARPAAQYRTRPGQCLMRTGQGQQQQIVRIAPTSSGGKCAFGHDAHASSREVARRAHRLAKDAGRMYHRLRR